MMDILQLSDEVLIHIFTFMSGLDRIALSLTCIRFNRILCEKKLLRNLHFPLVYKLTTDSLKTFLKPKLRHENLQGIDLSGCYWVNSSDILVCVRKLKNLKSLNVTDTSLTSHHLEIIVNTLPKLTRLSCSKAFKHPGNFFLEEVRCQFPSLKYLYIEDSTQDFADILYTLHHFPNLCEFWMRSILREDSKPSVRSRVQSDLLKPGSLKLPYLNALVLKIIEHDPESSSIYGNLFVTIISAACEENTAWQIYWLDVPKRMFDGYKQPVTDPSKLKAFLTPTLDSPVFQEIPDPYSFTDLKYLGLMMSETYLTWLRNCMLKLQDSSVTHLLTPGGSFINFCLPKTLVHLKISSCCEEDDEKRLFITAIGLLENLRSLSVPFCAFHEPNRQWPLSSQPGTFEGSKRKSHIVKEPLSNCKLELFSKNCCPNLQHLRLIDCQDCHSSRRKPWDLAALIHISNWTQLRSLYMAGIEVQDSAFLIQIAKSCPFLERLGLADVRYYGVCSHYMHTLNETLRHCSNLKDFSFIERHVVALPAMMKTLQEHCPLLERVAIISDGKTEPLPVDLCVTFISNCPSLVMFYVSFHLTTSRSVSRFRKEVKERFEKSRPYLWARMEKGHNSGHVLLKDCPEIHFREMIRLDQQLDIFPNSC